MWEYYWVGEKNNLNRKNTVFLIYTVEQITPTLRRSKYPTSFSSVSVLQETSHDLAHVLGSMFIMNLQARCHFCSVTQKCLTLGNTMDGSMTGFSVLHYLLRFAQTQVHSISDAIQLSHPLSSPSPLAHYLSQKQGLFQQVGSLHKMAKLLELQLKHQSFQWIFMVASSQAPLPMGILQARTLEWVATPSSRGSSQPRDQTQVSHIAVRFFTIWAMKEAQFPLGLTGLISLLVWKHQSEPCVCPLNTSAK